MFLQPFFFLSIYKNNNLEEFITVFTVNFFWYSLIQKGNNNLKFGTKVLNFVENISWVRFSQDYRKIFDTYIFSSFSIIGNLVDVVYLFDLKHFFGKNALNLNGSYNQKNTSVTQSRYLPNFFPFNPSTFSSYFGPVLSEKFSSAFFLVKIFFIFGFSSYLVQKFKLNV